MLAETLSNYKDLTNLVRMISTGDSMKPAIPAEMTTTLMLVIGLGLSRIFGPLRLFTTPRVGSGMLSKALRKDLVQVSIVFNRIPYINVEFVPFQTPKAPSFPHS